MNFKTSKVCKIAENVLYLCSFKLAYVYIPCMPYGFKLWHFFSQVHRQQPQQFNQTQLRYLLAAYRVGMLALETLARRVHDDRPQAKYARNPPYGEDVKWLLRVAKKLGGFCHGTCLQFVFLCSACC